MVESLDSSILKDIKTSLGSEESEVVFDTEIMMHINGALSELNQVGIGVQGYSITGGDDKWTEFVGDDNDLPVINLIKPFVYFNVKLIFDPPTASTAAYLQKTADKHLWRLREQKEANYE